MISNTPTRDQNDRRTASSNTNHHPTSMPWRLTAVCHEGGGRLGRERNEPGQCLCSTTGALDIEEDMILWNASPPPGPQLNYLHATRGHVPCQTDMAYSSAPQSASAEAFQLDVKSKLEPAIHSEETTQGDRVAPASEIAAEVEIDEKENRKLLRKIVWHIIPLLCLVYGLQFVSCP